MKASLALSAFLSLAALAPSACAYYTYGLGKSFSVGTAGSGPSIKKVSTTFNPGTPPTGQSGELILYPALSNGTGDFLMTSIESWQDQSFCGGTSSQWCIRTSVFSNRKSTDGQLVALDPNTPVTITFERASDESGWTQTAVVNDNIVSQLTFPSGPMTIFGLTTECDDYCTMTVSPQTYTNTTIELDSPETDWQETMVIGSTIYGDDTINTQSQKPTIVNGVSSDSDGSVWSFESISIPQLD